jgi:predicted DNA-binding transcriptional regulator AlpA
MQKLMSSAATPPVGGRARHSYSVKEVMDVTGWAKSVLYDKIAKGIFPRPYKPDPQGRKVRFDGPKVDEYQRQRIAERDRQTEAA